MKPKSKHTPTPWKSTATIFGQDRVCIYGGKDEKDIIGYLNLGKDQPGRANAEFIVTACNAHEHLVLAVKRAFELEKANHGMTSHAEAYQQALAKAEVTL